MEQDWKLVPYREHIPCCNCATCKAPNSGNRSCRTAALVAGILKSAIALRHGTSNSLPSAFVMSVLSTTWCVPVAACSSASVTRSCNELFHAAVTLVLKDDAFSLPPYELVN